MPVNLMHVGVRVTYDEHANLFRHVLALEHGNHGMPETVEALLRELVLTFGVARIDASAAHDVDELLAVTGSAAWLELMDVGQYRVGRLALAQ